jgi:hypothetical protein
MLRIRLTGSLRIATLLLAAVVLPYGNSLAQTAAPASMPVDEVRFGVIEPPVVAQKDITVRAPMSNQQTELAPIECSGMAWVDGALLIASDRHSHAVFASSLDLETMALMDPVTIPVIGNEQDLLEDAESLTVRHPAGGPTYVYTLSSLSNDRTEMALPKRQHMLRFVLASGQPPTPARPVVLELHLVREQLERSFSRTGIHPYRTYYNEAVGTNKNTYRWGNVEGMAFTPDGQALLCGMRNPLHHDRAILFVLTGVDNAFDTRDASRLVVTDIFTLPLGGRGVSDICWDPLTKGYIITAATSNGPRTSNDQPWPPNELDSAMFWWSGRKSEDPALVATFPDMKIEAVCRIGASRFVAVVSDERDVSEGRDRTAQSVLTVLYFTGFHSPGQERQ